MPSDTQLRAQLARRIRFDPPGDWKDFAIKWMAFNAIYGGESDRSERSRVMSCIRASLSESAALRVLRAVTGPIDLILAIPPGNMLLESSNPGFRSASQRCVGLYRDRRQSAVDRIAAVGGVVYQVRCNLLHGSKDPDDERDRMLVTQSLCILNELVPALEAELV